MSKVIVLGCGPAGLMAAHAAALTGADVRIFSKRRKSPMYGAQYLHMPIPETVKEDPFNVQYVTFGEPVQYRMKVYGQDWDGSVSPEDLEESHDGWDIRTTYDWLWDTYGGYVKDWECTPGNVRWLLSEYRPDLMVSTVPAPLLCAEGHQFKASKIWAANQCFAANIEDNMVICNGMPDYQWYRSSRIQGHENTEWPGYIPKPPIKCVEVLKPLKTNCTCYPEVLRAGRYGRWEKGVLSHDAFLQTDTALRK